MELHYLLFSGRIECRAVIQYRQNLAECMPSFVIIVTHCGGPNIQLSPTAEIFQYNKYANQT